MTDTTEPEPTTEEWIYLGRRITAKGTIGYQWRAPAGDLLLAKNLAPAAQIGAVFTVTTTPSAAGTSYFTAGPNAPRYARPDGLEEEEAIRYAAADAAAAVERDRKAANTKAAKVDAPLKPILDQLYAATQNLTRAEKRAVAVMLLETLWL